MQFAARPCNPWVRMKLLLLIPDGVGVRNFVLGPFLGQAAAVSTVDVLHVLPEGLRARYAAAVTAPVGWRELKAYDDEPLSFLLRSSLAYAQMYWVDSYPMRWVRRQPVTGSRRTRAAVGLARLIGRAAAGPRRIRMLDRLHYAAAGQKKEVEHYRRLLAEMRPSVLFCSHQRPVNILPPVLAARSLGIPTATFIFSWDNLTSKGRIAAPFDHFLVWSDLMREELVRYYPEVSPDRVHVVGTPQFDPYADQQLLWSREEFFGRVGADPRRPLLCFSGGDVSTCPEDPEHVRVLMELIRAGRVRGDPQVLLRPMPVDVGTRYDEVRARFPELIYAKPQWVHPPGDHWATVTPLPEDLQFLVNLAHHADLNINRGSTMTLDFAIHDTPVVNVAFNVASPPPFDMPLWELYHQYEHYRPVIELGAARFSRTPDELADHINAYLADPTLDRDARRRFVELEVGVPVGQSSRRTVDVLTRIAS
jgi:hypothetical protein